MTDSKADIIAPPPWLLTGNAVMLIYHFPHSFNQQYGFLEAYQQKHYKGWIGMVMLVDYHTSNVGPYQELLFAPGLFSLGGKMTFSISKIYVSSQASLLNGRANWGIPKELASFENVHNANGSTVFKVHAEERTFFDARIRPWGPSFPLSTKIFPLFRIAQQKEQQLLLTKPVMSGKARLAAVAAIATDARLFPPVDRLKPLAVLAVDNFLMSFPPAAPLITKS